jgi:protein PhnA
LPTTIPFIFAAIKPRKKYMETKDSTGNILSSGDAVIFTKTLNIKGMNASLKKGDKVKNIRLTDDPKEIEIRLGKSTVVIKTEFVKKG